MYIDINKVEDLLYASYVKKDGDGSEYYLEVGFCGYDDYNQPEFLLNSQVISPDGHLDVHPQEIVNWGFIKDIDWDIVEYND